MRAGCRLSVPGAGVWLLALMFLATACSSDSEVFRPSDGSSTAATGPTDDVTEATVQVTDAGATIAVSAGAVVVPPGALPAGTTVTVAVAPADSIEFPAAATPAGSGLSIGAPEQPTSPVLLEIPVPAGEATDDLYLLHLADDGSYEYVGGAVEDGMFVTAVRSFSEAILVHLVVQNLLDLPHIDLPTLYADEPMDWLPASAEAVDLALGGRAEPFVRAVRILGPGLLSTGVDGVYQVDDFDARRPEFVTYDWDVYGGSGLVLESAEWETARFTALEPGAYTIVVEATDPTTGATATAARRVRVDDESLVVWAVPDADGYCCRETPVVTLGVSGGTPPVEVAWSFGSGAQDSAVAESVPWETAVTLPPVEFAGVLRVTATDADGETAEAVVPIPERLSGWLGMIVGPLRVQVGETADFALVTTPDVDPDRLIWLAYPAAEMTGGRKNVAIAWGEPGLARLRVLYESPTVGLVNIDDLVVGITGPAEAVEARIAEAPESLSVGEEGVWRLRAKGGVVAPETGFRGYTALVDFGDGTVLPGVEMPANTATRLSPAVEVSHAYEETGDYEVKVIVVDSAGTMAEIIRPVTVAAARLVADGEFIVPTVVPVEVVENAIRIVINERRVRITRLAWYTVTGYTGFEVGNDETFEAPCKNHSSWELQELQASYDPATGAISGTATMLWDRIDIGTECPFGGMDAEQTRTMALEATLADGVIEGTFRAADDLLPDIGMAFTATVTG